jgi:hypothetical protein
MAENEASKKSDKKVLLLGIIIVLALINGITLYLHYKDSEEKQEVLAGKEEELGKTYSRLDSVHRELKFKIIELRNLGANVDSLVVIQKLLEKEKTNLRSSRNVALANLNKLNDKLEGYETLLKQQDEKISKLEQINKALLTENTGLKTEKNKLNDSISQLSEVKNQLNEKVALASVLKAENIVVKSVSESGKEKEGGEYKARQLDAVRVQFNIAENKVAKFEPKDIYLSITDPDGSPLYDVASGSGTFIHNGKEQFYTAKQNILFDNTQQKLSFDYKKGSEYKKGTYKVEIFSEGYKIGNQSFLVK